MSNKEVWKNIAGYDGKYQVSSLGRVRSKARKVKDSLGRNLSFPAKIVKPCPYKPTEPYVYVDLSKNGKRIREDVSNLVLNAFKGKRPKKTHQRRHLDNDPSNNAASNLEWGTFEENVTDRVEHGKEKKKRGEPLKKPKVDLRKKKSFFAKNIFPQVLPKSTFIAERWD